MESAVLACEVPTLHAAAADAGPGAGGDVVSLRRSALAACLTCPLCGRLLRDAATITECLHTFCRKCISEEFINKEVCCCPICSIDLGCAPLEKLRIDHSLQYVRSKVFPFKRQKVEGPEVTSPITSPIKKKERSLSSLTTQAPQMFMQKSLTKRRTKASCLHNLSLHSTLRDSSNVTKKSGGWRPLGCHFRAAKNKRSLRFKSEDGKTTEKKTDDPLDVTPASQAKTKRQFTRRGSSEKRTGTKKLLILKGKQKKIKPKKTPNKKRRLRALWFHLLAAFDQKGQPPLPQIPSKFLRIKDVNLPASFIQKYLVKKLNLSSETEINGPQSFWSAVEPFKYYFCDLESFFYSVCTKKHLQKVEILCSGRPVSPGITLHDLADCWLDKRPKGRVRSSVGTPAAEFVLTVFYARAGASFPETENNQD